MKRFGASRNEKEVAADTANHGLPSGPEDLSSEGIEHILSEESSGSPAATTQGVVDTESADLDSEDISGDYVIDNYVANILPEEVVRRLNILPVSIKKHELNVITTRPLNVPGLDEVKLLTGLRVRPFVVPEMSWHAP